MPPEQADAIRTPDQRLRVFVSSTLAELAPERAAVRRAITTLGLAPVMFELGARPHPPQELYRAYLAQSDVFVGLYWQSYGWVGPGMDISGLEDEFRLSGSRPRLLYLKAPAPDREPRLAAMIDELRSEGTDAYRTFRTTRELARLVRDDLALLLSERFADSQRAREAPEPSAAASAPRRSLPVTTTTLVGREGDIAALVDLVSRPDVRLVTLTGPGGIGKTRLAVAVGELLERTRDIPVSFAPLAAVDDEHRVLGAVAAAVGAVVEGGGSPADVLADHFGDDPALLVLDNLEQVAAVAPRLEELLEACPGLTILATSRVLLRLRAEHEYVVQPLDSGTRALDATTADTLALPAVRLFLDRAEAVRRGIPPSPENATAVAEICRRLDGVPLAIELAAARTRLLDPVALLSRLRTVLDGLGTGPVDLPARQRTLRATVEWSAGLLDDVQRRLLAELSVFADGWTLDAASAVSDATEDAVLELLDELVGHSLVSVEAGESPRLRMLTAVREYAAEQLAASGDREAVEARHAEHFAVVVQPPTSADRIVRWADDLVADDENVRRAIDWFFAHDPRRLPHLLRSLWIYWQLHDRMPDGRKWIVELRRRTDLAALDAASRGEVLFVDTVTAVEVGDDDAALAAVAAIQELLPAVEEAALRNALLLALSWALPITDDLDSALAAAEEAYAGFCAAGDPFMAFAALTAGMIQTSLGRDDDAARHLTEVDALGARYSAHWLTSSARTLLAALSVRRGDLEGARALVRRSLEGADDTRVGTLTACFTIVAYAQIAAAEGDPTAAAQALGCVDALRERGGLLAWPNSRRAETALRDEVARRMDARAWDEARAVGARLTKRDALALVREDLARS